VKLRHDLAAKLTGFRTHSDGTFLAMMDAKPFEKPVVVELGKVGHYQAVKSTKEAVELLLMAWPNNRGLRHEDAVEACLKVLDGYRSSVDARDAFVAAAKESDVLVPESLVPERLLRAA